MLNKPPPQNQVLLSSIPLEDFKELFRECIKTEFTSTFRKEPQEEDDFITENEARDLLQISKVSLKLWRDQEKIPFYRFGSRIRYKKSELINSAIVKKRLKGGSIAL